MRKLLIIVPAVVVLVLVWLFLPARKVSIEPYGMLSLETKVILSVGSEATYASPSSITFGVATASGTTAGAGRTGNGNLTIPLPTGWQAGQLGIILLYSDQGTGSTPTGWNQVTGSPWGAGSEKLQAFYRFLQSGDSNPVTTISGSTTYMSHVAAIATYNGVDTTTPVEVVGTASNGTGTPMTAGSIITLTDGAWALGLCGRGDNENASGQTFGGSATGVTERFDSGTSQGNDSQVSLYDKEIATAGATGGGSATTSVTDPWISVLIALKPAAEPSITVDPTSWTLNGFAGGSGKILPNTTYYANPQGDTTAPSSTVQDNECGFTITNSSTMNINIVVNCSDFSGGDANMTNSNNGSNGTTSYGGYSWYSGMTYTNKKIMKTTGSDVLWTSTNPGDDIKIGAEITTQTNEWTGSTSSTATMTITATAS